MAKILIIEDEQSILKMIAYDLKQFNYEVDTATDGLKGYEKAKTGEYDIIILDLMLPGMNGLKIAEKLRDKQIKSYIIMLTAMDDEYQKIHGFEVGADDYITKPFSPRELTARIKAVLRRQETKKDEDIIEYDNIRMNTSSYETYVNNEKIELTLKEFELLLCLIKNHGKALSRDQLLTTLWGYNYDGDTRVVDVHIFKLREKILNGSERIKTVRGIGYKLV